MIHYFTIHLFASPHSYFLYNLESDTTQSVFPLFADNRVIYCKKFHIIHDYMLLQWVSTIVEIFRRRGPRKCRNLSSHLKSFNDN